MKFPKEQAAEISCRESEILDLLDEGIPGGLMILSCEPGFPVLHMNAEMLRYLNYPDFPGFCQATGTLAESCAHPEDREAVAAERSRVLAEGGSYRVTSRMLCRENGCVWILEKGRMVSFHGGKKALFCVCLDVTGQVEARAELESIAQVPLGGVFKAKMDAQFTLVYANDCYFDLHGCTREQFRRDFQGGAARLVHPDDLAQITARLHEMIASGEQTASFEYRVLRPDGQVVWLHMSGAFSCSGEVPMLTGMVIDITQRKQAEEKLLHSEERFRIAISQTGIKVWEYDIPTRSICQANASFPLDGTVETIENIPESLIEAGKVCPESVADFRNMYRKIHRGASTASCTVRMLGADGKAFWEKIEYTTVFDGQGKPLRAVAVSEDVTEQKEVEQRVFYEERMRELLSMEMMASCQVDLTTHVVDMLWSRNPLPGEMRDIASFEELFHCIWGMIHNQEDQKKFEEGFSLAAFQEAYRNKQTMLQGEFRCGISDGSIRWLAFRTHLLTAPDSGHPVIFCYIQDIDSRKKTELALKARAERDFITGLYNKQTTLSMIEETLLHSREDAGECALVMLDLDNFKQINDTYGHLYGDRILTEVGRNLPTMFEGSALAGRFGGDEFLMLVSNIPSAHWAYAQAEKLCHQLSQTYILEDQAVELSVSVGLAFAPHKTAEFQAMYRQADAALYAAKRRGKNRCMAYNSQLLDGAGIPQQPESCIAKNHADCNCMMDQLEDMAVVIDEESREICYMNRAAQAAFCPDGNYLKQKCYSMIQGFSHPCLFCRSHVPQGQGFQTWENQNMKLRKRLFIREKQISWNGRPARLELFSPGSHCGESQSERTASRVFLDCAEILLSAKSLNRCVDAVLGHVGQYYDAERVYLLFGGADHPVFPAVHRWQREPSQAQEEIGKREDWNRLLHRERMVLIGDMSKENKKTKAARGLFPDQRVYAVYGAALCSGENMQGQLLVVNPRANLMDHVLLEALPPFLLSEITGRMLQWQKEYFDYHDPLTGLLNFKAFKRHMGQLQDEVLSSLGVVCIDINQLKAYNQRFGYEQGSEVVRQVAEILKKCFRGNQIFRFSSDEFTILCQDVAEETFLGMLRQAEEAADNIYPRCFAYGQTWVDQDISVMRMLHHAEELLLVEKQDYIKQASSPDTTRWGKLLQGLLDSIRNREFQVYLQPKADVATGDIIGAEALIRYIHPKKGIFTPDKFLPLLEENRLIHHIDFFVLEETCKIIDRWIGEGLRSVPVSVNFSRTTLLETRLVEQIDEILASYPRVGKDMIEIEITETIREVERTTLTQIGQQIIQAGYRLSLDDFGAEYSNIYILSSLPLNTLKIDRRVINDLYSNQKTRRIVSMLMDTCQELGIESVAEGVETPEQLGVLKELGCTYAQGYLYNKPLPVTYFENRYLRPVPYDEYSLC